MSYGPKAVFSVSMASAGTLTSSVDLQRGWKRVYVEVPTMTSNTELYVQVSSDGTTFRRVCEDQEQPVQMTLTMASLATLTAVFDFGYGTRNRYVLTPSMATATQIFVQGSHDNSTFKRVCVAMVNTSTIQTNDFGIQSGLAVRWVPIPDTFRFIKMELGTGTTQVANSFTVIGAQTCETDLKIPSFVTNRMVPLPTSFRFLKVESSATIDNGVLFNIVCSD